MLVTLPNILNLFTQFKKYDTYPLRETELPKKTDSKCHQKIHNAGQAHTEQQMEHNSKQSMLCRPPCCKMCNRKSASPKNGSNDKNGRVQLNINCGNTRLAVVDLTAVLKCLRFVITGERGQWHGNAAHHRVSAFMERQRVGFSSNKAIWCREKNQQSRIVRPTHRVKLLCEMG